MDKEELQGRTLKFAVDARSLALQVMAMPGGRGTAEQLLNASSSVGANYRSACRGRSRSEFIAKLGVAVEEADECVYWLELIRDSQLLPANGVETLLDEACQLRAILAASYGTARANHQRSKRRHSHRPNR
jgi:four helix bundle protein